MCEAKIGENGLDKTDRQSQHNGGLAVLARCRFLETSLRKTGARAKELNSTILVCTISHNNHMVNLYGHCAVANAGAEHGLDFLRH